MFTSTGVVLKNQYRKKAEKEMKRLGLRFFGYKHMQIILVDKDGQQTVHKDWQEVLNFYKEK